jgi:hypothetical protein|tara:strand:- start:4415 stop:7576 length:3162 start_codon:yes stop_codon:yes gene_type:complete
MPSSYIPISIAYVSIALSSSLAADEVSFNQDIKPILSDRCFKCHGPDAKNQASEFRLNTREQATADLGDEFFGIVPGNIEESDLHWRIWDELEEDVMPPSDSNLSLNDDEKKLLDKWIEQGAPYDTHWSFKSLPRSVETPANDSKWVRNEIDQFVEAKLVENELNPAVESSKEKWLRRVSFDLSGLPPTIEEIEAFLDDDSPQAFEQVADRLLSSTAYAERLTSEWLDVARYSDSYGYQRDDERFVWPWRDWVIDAFAKNMPYDEFMTLQLAGDLLPNATQADVLPTAFNRLHAHKKEGGIVLEEYRVEYVADRTQTFSSAFLGLTMECCRCHDHKYDPIPTRDYYQLSSFFSNVDEAGQISFFTDAVPTPAMPFSTPELDAELAKAQREIDEAENKVDAFRMKAGESEAFREWLENRPDLRWPGLVADVPFDASAEGEIINYASTENPGKTKDVNSIEAGVYGNSIRFTGDDALTIPKIGHFPREQPFSSSLWIRADEIRDRENIYSRSAGADDSASLGYELLLLDGKLTASLIHFWPGNAVRVQAKEAITAKDWHHVVVTYDGSSRAKGICIYLNGESLELAVVKDHLTRQITEWKVAEDSGRKQLVFGQRYRDRGFKNGQVDEFKMFDRELAQAEAIQLFDQKHLAQLLRSNLTSLDESDRAELLDYYLATGSDEWRQLQTTQQAARAKWNQNMDTIPGISIMRERSDPRQNYILERGLYDSHGEEVTANTPHALPPFPTDMPRNRLGLAHWLTDPDHPLTARVAVNRYWQMIFGEGLVRTPEDFGSQGAPPTHPELLDWLSRDFVDSGWDLRQLLKQMVLSSTYRQSTFTDDATRRTDPENLYLSHSNPDRITAEMIRDNALAVSGLLVDQVGGEPVKPYDLAVSFKPLDHDTGDGLYRRSLYTFWKRNAPAPAMVAFDASKRDVCSLKREATASPLQPLVTLNGPQFVEAARVLGERLLLKHEGNRKALIKEAFLKLTSRKPDAKELKVLLRLYQAQLDEFEGKSAAADSLLQMGDAPSELSQSKEEHAAATIVVNALMNLNESLIQR